MTERYARKQKANPDDTQNLRDAEVDVPKWWFCLHVCVQKEMVILQLFPHPEGWAADSGHIPPPLAVPEIQFRWRWDPTFNPFLLI